MEFEARKVVSRVFRNMLIRQIGTRYPTVSHIAENKDIIFSLLDGYKMNDGNLSLLDGRFFTFELSYDGILLRGHAARVYGT